MHSSKPAKTFHQKLVENPDSFDYFDFGTTPNVSEAYLDPVLPDHIRARLAERAAQRGKDTERPEIKSRRLVFIENDGALFRGISPGHPEEVWSSRERRWKPYRFEEPFKPVEWGAEISEAEAQAIMDEP